MKYASIVEKLTLDEKIKLLSGDKYWHTVGFPSKGIPAIMMTDGPHGLRKQTDTPKGINDSAPATCFPAAITSGATWNKELVARMARAIGEEALAEGVSVVLGPGVNIKRNPKCGRNFEYYSEDPYLAGQMAASFITALQSTGVGTSLKHFACNSQEYKRHNSDSQVDERTLREIYLRAFEIAVKSAQPATVMAAYCRLNGEFCACNKRLLTDILRKEWGFKGLVVSDWSAMARHVDGIDAGCDLGMPGGTRYEDNVVKEAVESGTLSMEAVDECCGRVIALAMKGDEVHQAHKDATYDKDEHDALTAQIASEGAVLLKNDGALPLKPNSKVLLVGHMAKDARYQGAGSSHIVPNKITNITDVMSGAFAEGYNERGDTTEELLKEVEERAKTADTVVVVAGLPDRYESEGFDRNTLDLPDGINRVVEVAANANSNTVVVLMAGGAVLLPWLDKVKAVLFAGLCGQSGTRGIADILTGKVNPSGHLTETWPLSLKDVPSEEQYSKRTKNVQYLEGLYVGYRYYDKADVKVAFPFGHGLSYTTFEYTGLQVKDAGKAHCTVSVAVKNTSIKDGAEVVQVYVQNPSGAYRADKELRAFEKVFLKAGEIKTVDIVLDDKSFCVYDVTTLGWKTIGGKYTVMVGSSSRDIRMKQTVRVEGEEGIHLASALEGSWYVHPKSDSRPSQSEWLTLMGSMQGAEPPKDFDHVAEGGFDMSSSMGEIAEHSHAAEQFVQRKKELLAKGMGVDIDSDNEEYQMAIGEAMDCALHGVVLFGNMKKEMAKALIDVANGKISDEEFRIAAEKFDLNR